MIRAIAAIDGKRGIADNNGIPWLGQIPSDQKYYHAKIRNTDVIMGYGMYLEMKKPYPDSMNFVATTKNQKLRNGFIPITNAQDFIRNYTKDLWNIGGAGLYATTIDLVEELYITQLQGDHGCTKYFPDFTDQFHKVSESKPITENNITFTFQVWRK